MSYISIRSLYSSETWKYRNEKDWLEKRPIEKSLPAADFLEDKMSGHTTRLGILSYVNHDCLVCIITGCGPAKILYHLQVIPFVKH